MDDSSFVQLWLYGIGCASFGLGQPERGVRLWGAAEALGIERGVRPSPISLTILDYENNLASARSRLGGSFAATFGEGEAMSGDAAIEYAISGEEDPRLPITQPHTEQHPNLTSRQREVAILISLGLSNREIASELNLSEHTVASHARDVRRKLGVKSRIAVAAELRANLENT